MYNTVQKSDDLMIPHELIILSLLNYSLFLFTFNTPLQLFCKKQTFRPSFWLGYFLYLLLFFFFLECFESENVG